MLWGGRTWLLERQGLVQRRSGWWAALAEEGGSNCKSVRETKHVPFAAGLGSEVQSRKDSESLN